MMKCFMKNTYEEHISPGLIDKMEGTRLFLLSWTLPTIT